MLSLLIVDDEVIIADGLYQMLQEHFQDQLVVRRCYSYAQAEAILEKNRIDILMTDIEMPGATGLELHREVRRRWPMIRVIYLTGYSDFSYARQAIEQNAIAYVLKSEGDQVICAAIEKAIRSFDEENEKLMSQPGFVSERPRHLRQLVYHAMHGGYLPPEQLERASEDSGLGFSLEKPVYIGCCFFDNSVTMLLMHQAMALIERLMHEQMPLLLTDMNAGAFSILFQTRGAADQDALTGNLEAVQRIMERQGNRMTVCLLEQPAKWSELGLAAVSLLHQMGHTSPAPGELVVLTSAPAGTVDPAQQLDGDWSEGLECLQRMHEYMLTGQQELFFAEEPRFWELVNSSADPSKSRALFSALSMFISDASRSLPDGENLCSQLAELTSQPGQQLAYTQQRMRELAEAVFSARAEKQNHRQKRLVSQIDAFIVEHLSGDLSLTAISDALHFHPTYISRVYKEFSGESLSDAIAQKRLAMACAMLRESDQPISSIAVETGFSTANYFARWFRKWMGCTAQEYRDMQRPPLH